ncbi:MAG TPA: Hsp70 family protein, partial [Xanthomonadaceae bacterium]|nr:Hsp70 family protein [Xanthomonadaceae bacterium]
LRHVSPDQAIAIGSCIAAGMKERNAALEEIVMTDVCPYTLGIETSRTSEQGQRTQGHFSPIIGRNVTVPCSRAQTFSPLEDGQKVLRLRVFQGESPLVAHNVLLGSLDVPLLPNAKREQSAVETRFTYDINGVLQVEAIHLATGLRHELILQNNPGVLSDEDIRIRLAQLAQIKIHPREDQENMAIVSRCERLYEELLQYRPVLQEWLAKFMGAIEQQDRDVITRHRNELTKALDQLEGQIG